MSDNESYQAEIRRVRSQLIVASLQDRPDIKARHLIENFKESLIWEPLSHFMIEAAAWRHVVESRSYDPKLVFCHPHLMQRIPSASLHYRGMCGISLKAAREYVGAVESLETGRTRRPLSDERALTISRTYNLFISSILTNATDWTLENGYRTVIATLGITLDGVMRNRIGSVAEDRIRRLLLEWIHQRDLAAEPFELGAPIMSLALRGGIDMRFGSDPDIAFRRGNELAAVVEIKGGIDPAGALERYGAATKSFQHAIAESPRCRNYYLGAVYTPELKRRIENDRLVEKVVDIIELLSQESVREAFFHELFHHSLRLI